MKKTLLSLITLLIFLLLSGCNYNKGTEKHGEYVEETKGTIESGEYLEETKAEISIHISGGKFSLYEIINSSNNTMGASGTYVIDGDVVTMTTDDNKYTYVFKKDGDNLFFQKNNFLIDDKIGAKIKPNAKFHLIGH